MFHEPLTGYQHGSSWSGIALPEDMQHSAPAIPLAGGRDPTLSGAQSPVKQGFPVRTPGSATPAVLAMKTLQIAYKPHIRPAMNPLKEVDDTRVSSCKGLGAAIAVSERICN
jgi:hypothetical protein